MANFLGNADEITIYYNKYSQAAGVASYVSSFTLPTPGRGDRHEDFEADKIQWRDLDKILRERIFGYRLKASYFFREIDSEDFENLVELYNGAYNIFMEFNTVPARYEVKIVRFRRDLAGGLNYADSLDIAFEGVKLLQAYPNPDAMIKCMRTTNTGLILAGA